MNYYIEQNTFFLNMLQLFMKEDHDVEILII